MNQRFELLDALAIISFAVGLANYSENVDQNTMQEAIKGAVTDVHKHLERQDERLESIERALVKIERD